MAYVYVSKDTAIDREKNKVRVETEYTADDEEPDCMCCCNCCGEQKICDKCGPEFFWTNYKRVEYKYFDLKDLLKGDN